MVKTQRFIIDVITDDKGVKVKISCFEHDFSILKLMYDRITENKINLVLDAENKINLVLDEKEKSLTISVLW